MGWSFTIGTISGIRIRIHLTFLLFLFWIGAYYWHQGGMAAATNSLAYILLLFLCVVLHEFGHILTARHFGSQTLDVILLPIGGVARMKSIPQKPGQELVVALAGPAVNLVIAVLLITVVGSGAIMRNIAQPGADLHIFTQLAIANVFLALFNLLPAFPMDGGRALRALLSYRLGRTVATSLAMRISHVLAIGFGGFALMRGNPLLMLIAVFVYFGASAENQDTQLHQLARRLRVSDAMITQFSTLPPDSYIEDVIAVLNHSTQHDVPIVDGFGKMIGFLTRSQILQALHEYGGRYPVADVMRVDIPAISGETGLDEALRMMGDRSLPVIAVANLAGHLVGMLTLENLGQMLLLENIRTRK